MTEPYKFRITPAHEQSKPTKKERTEANKKAVKIRRRIEELTQPEPFIETWKE